MHGLSRIMLWTSWLPKALSQFFKVVLDLSLRYSLRFSWSPCFQMQKNQNQKNDLTSSCLLWVLFFFLSNLCSIQWPTAWGHASFCTVGSSTRPRATRSYMASSSTTSSCWPKSSSPWALPAPTKSSAPNLTCSIKCTKQYVWVSFAISGLVCGGGDVFKRSQRLEAVAECVGVSQDVGHSCIVQKYPRRNNTQFDWRKNPWAAKWQLWVPEMWQRRALPWWSSRAGA